jgi:hypothetical protein
MIGRPGEEQPIAVDNLFAEASKIEIECALPI